MTSRTAYPATESNGDTLTTTNFDKLGGDWIGYVEITANQTGISTSTTITGLDSLVVTVNTSRRVIITAGGQVTCDSTAGGGRIKIFITEGATTLRAIMNNTLAASAICSFEGSVVKTPSAGSHTYTLNGVKASGSGTFDLNASSNDPGPAWMLVRDTGPA